MEKPKLALVLILALLMVFTVVACDDDDVKTPTPPQRETPDDSPSAPSDDNTTPPSEPDDDNNTSDGNQGSQLKKITGVTFANASYTYDGSKKELKVSGTLPTGVTAQYSNNTGTNAGTYKASVILSGDGYETLKLDATLTINKANFSGLVFTGASFTYDGSKKTITVTGAPEGSTISYTGCQDNHNGATDPGTYTIKATVQNPNYNDKTLTATLTITQSQTQKPTIQNITFTSKSFEYDEQKHTIEISGNIPTGAKVTYTGGEDGSNGATNVGSYEIIATITHSDYQTLTLNATLTIKSTEEMLHVFFSNNNVFFQNTLDDKNMYIYSGNAVSFASYDKPVSVITVGSDTYYLSKDLLSSGIYKLNATKPSNSNCLLEVSADQIVSDGTYIYYNVNKLFKTEDNGIYRVKISELTASGENDEITPVRLTTARAEVMTFANGYIYFANKDDGNKLYAVSTSANEGVATKIYDYKVSELITDGNKIYFVRHNLTGNCIYSINVAGGLHTLINDGDSKLVKITVSNGKYLTIIGDYIYFLNTDMVTSTIFGDGIYRASINGSTIAEDIFTLLVGSTKVLDGADDNMYALATDGEDLYFYRASDKHLHKYDISSETETDLLKDWTAPEKSGLVFTYYEKACEYNGEIYYLNMLDGSKLYKYNIATKTNVRITNSTVADFYIHNGNIYYSTVKLLVNFDLYRMSLTNGEPERISTDKCKNFIGDYLYYNNFTGKNALCRMNLITLEVSELWGKKVNDGESTYDNDTVYYDGYIYFTADGSVFSAGYLYRYSLTTNTAEIVSTTDGTTFKPLEYMIYDGKILMMNTKGTNYVVIYDIATQTAHNIYKLNTTATVSDDARGMFVYNGEMYFYINVATGSSEKGLYKVTYSNGEYSTHLVDKFDGYYICESMVIGDKVYFMDTWQIKGNTPTGASSCKLCVLDMTTKKITVLN